MDERALHVDQFGLLVEGGIESHPVIGEALLIDRRPCGVDCLGQPATGRGQQGHERIQNHEGRDFQRCNLLGEGEVLLLRCTTARSTSLVGPPPEYCVAGAKLLGGCGLHATHCPAGYEPRRLDEPAIGTAPSVERRTADPRARQTRENVQDDYTQQLTAINPLWLFFRVATIERGRPIRYEATAAGNAGTLKQQGTRHQGRRRLTRGGMSTWWKRCSSGCAV